MTNDLTASSTLALLDTNVLVYALDSDSPHHATSAMLLANAENPNAGLCVAPQNLAELLAIVTDPRRVAKPRSIETAVEAVRQLMALPGLVLLPVPLDVCHRLAAIVQKYTVKGQRVFDAFLVATMLGNGITRLWTFNASDFAPFMEIEALAPQTQTAA
jgi:toxin-antitoxin system PIN domain toxin